MAQRLANGNQGTTFDQKDCKETFEQNNAELEGMVLEAERAEMEEDKKKEEERSAREAARKKREEEEKVEEERRVNAEALRIARVRKLRLEWAKGPIKRRKQLG